MRAAPRRRTPVRHVQRARRQPAAALPGFIGGDASGGGGELPEKADVVALVAAGTPAPWQPLWRVMPTPSPHDEMTSSE